MEDAEMPPQMELQNCQSQLAPTRPVTRRECAYLSRRFYELTTKPQKKEQVMKTRKTLNFSGLGRTLLGALALALLVSLTAPQETHAAQVSAGAKIHNSVSVTYSAGSFTETVGTSVDVTVITLASAPDITLPTEQDVTSGTIVNYTYTIKSNANGPDTYDTSLLTNTNTDLGRQPPLQSIPTSPSGVALSSAP